MRKNRPRQNGFTLLELAAASVLVVVMLGATWNLMSRSQIFFDDQAQRLEVEVTGRRVLGYLTEELRVASSGSVLPAVLANSPTLQFQRVIGIDTANDSAPILGPVNTVEFALAPGENADAVDENGDGRADEGSLRHTIDCQPARVVSENILGVRFSSTARGVEIAVDVGVVDRNGLLIQQTFTEHVRFRH